MKNFIANDYKYCFFTSNPLWFKFLARKLMNFEEEKVLIKFECFVNFIQDLLVDKTYFLNS